LLVLVERASGAARFTEEVNVHTPTTMKTGEYVGERPLEAEVPLGRGPALALILVNDENAFERPTESAGHAEPQTPVLYERRQKKVTRNIVERIST
jgi:hypothetical protein